MIARAGAGLLALALAACAAGPAQPPGPAPEAPALRSVELQNPGFELDVAAEARCMPRWECTAHSDANSYTWRSDSVQLLEGLRSLRIERVRNEPWGTISQVVRDPALRGARVRFSVALRLEGAEGAGAGPFVFAHDGGGRIIADAKSLARGTTSWQRIAVEFDVPANATLVEAGITLEGPGRVWVDAARLDILSASVAEKKPV